MREGLLTPFGIDPARIAILPPNVFTRLCNDLIRAEASRTTLPQTFVDDTVRETVPDGGIDSRVREPSTYSPSSWGDWLPAGSSVWQYKAGACPSATVLARDEFTKPEVQAARWLSDSVQDTVRQRTFERYESIVRVHLVPAIGRVKLKSLTPAHVRGLYRDKLDAGLAPGSVLHIHRALSKALKPATDDGLIPRNAAGPVRPPRPRREEIRPLDRKQAWTFLEAAKVDRLEALYVVAVTAGLRRGELQGLKWEDVDLDTGTLQVRRTLSEPKGGYIFEAPKSGKGRSIRLTRKANAALREHRKRQLEKRMERDAGLWVDHGLVFPSGVGTPISGGNLNRAFKAMLRRAGLSAKFRFHDLRHTCATLLLRQSVNPKYVQELLGHADISLTLNVYSHVLPDMGDAAATAMDAALG